MAGYPSLFRDIVIRYATRSVLIFSAIFGTPFVVGAQITITEIMYDALGSDDGHEWIEVKNGGSGSIDLSSYRFLEAGVNHKLTLVRGVAVVANSYAIVADDSEKFLLDFPNFSGVLYDSSFSLSNTGEILSIKLDDAVIDSVNYVPNESADGTGGTLQKAGSSFVALSATPGVSSDLGQTVEIEPLSPGSDNNPPNSPSGGNNSSSENLIPANDTRKGMVADPEDPKIVVNAGNDRNGIAGAPVTFSGSARIGTNPAPESARFLWNFGDGKTFIGKNTTHVYRSPGRYLSTLTVSSGDTSTTDMATISIGNSPMEIGEVVVGPSGFITVTNQGQTAIDISSWYLEAGGKWFIFPQGTFIAAKGEVPFDALTTELLPLTPEAVSLRFPSGLEAARFGGVQRKDEGITASIEGKASPLEEGVSVTKANEGEVIPIASQMRVNADEMLSNAALVSEAEDEKRKGSLWWYGALVFVLALGTVGVVLVEKKKPVDEFEIIEGDE